MADTDTEPTVEAPAADQSAAAADPDPFDNGADTFDRKYVEKLRQENARYRTEGKQARDDLGRYTTAFDGLDEQARDSILAIPAYLKGGPDKQAELATWLRAQADGLTATEQAEVSADLEDAADDKGGKLTPGEVQKIIDAKLAERDQQAAIDREGENIRKQVEDLGVKWQSEEATALLALAASHFGADIGKAHEQMAKWAQAAVDQYVGGKQQDATGPRPVPDAGQAAGAAPAVPLTFKDADRAANAYIAARRGTPGR